MLRTDTLAELFDVTSLLANQPIRPDRGWRSSDGGGPGILAADACEAAGLEVPPLPDDVRERLAEWLPAVAGIGNPVDMIASATADDYRRAIRAARDAGQGRRAHRDLRAAAGDAPRTSRRPSARPRPRLTRPVPILAVFLSAGAAPAGSAARRPPSRPTPTPRTPPTPWSGPCATASGGRGLKASCRRSPMSGQTVARRSPRCWPSAGHAGWTRPRSALLSLHGLPLVEEQLVTTPTSAGEAATHLGVPVALKGIASGVIHKATCAASASA